MPKKAAKTKREQQLLDRKRELAERLFVKLYAPDCGKTLEHLATEAIKAAEVFYATCLPLTKE